MIIKYDMKKFFVEKGLKQSHFAEKIGISKQLMGYHLKKGDLPVSMLTIIAEEIGMPVDKMIKLLNDKYIKLKI
jgi:transcriptional regulator with XRE-family HTH domain